MKSLTALGIVAIGGYLSYKKNDFSYFGWSLFVACLIA